MKWRDVTLEELLEYILDEDLEGQKKARGEFIKNKFGPQWHGLHGYEDLDAFIEKLGEIDPSPKGIYMAWMARLAITKPQENRAEDLDRVGNDLSTFEQFKNRIQNKDINAYKSFQDLFDVIAPFLKPQKKSKEDVAKEKEAAKFAKLKNEIIVVYSGPDGWIRIPTTQEAAVYLGQGTRWCTAASKGNNMFNYYSKSDNLFVVFDKASGERYQLHIDSGQFANDADRNIGMKAVPEWARKPILDYYKEHNPQLSLKQVMSLSSFGDENLAKGTEHEALIDLMQRYGV